MGFTPQHIRCAPNTFRSHLLLIAFLFAIVALQSTLALPRYHHWSRVKRGALKRQACLADPDKVWCGRRMKCKTGKRCDLKEDCNDTTDMGDYGKDERKCLIANDVNIDQGVHGPRVRKGGDVTLTCRFHDKRNHDRNSTHIVWYEKIAKDLILQPREEYEIVDNETVQLHLTNLTRHRFHQYYCMFDHMTADKSYLGGVINVYVGIPPETPILTCANSNFERVHCNVTSSIFSGVSTNFTMQYRFLHTEVEESPSWEDCPGKNCTFLRHTGNTSMYSIDGVAEEGEELEIRAMESNFFGDSAYVEIDSYIIREELKPSPVENFEVSDQTSTSLTLTWDMPSDLHSSTNPNDHYALACEMKYSNEGNPVDNGTAEIRPYTPTTHQLNNLTPNAMYKISIRCYMDKSKRSNWAEVKGRTLQDAPGGTVQSLNYTSEAARGNVFMRDITLKWQDVLVEEQYGVISGYTVYFESASGDGGMVDTTELSVTLGDLHRFQEYTVNVNAYSRWGAGPNATITLQDETSAPTSPKEEGIDLKVVYKTNSSLKLRWDMATSPSGTITQYELKWSPVKEGQWSDPISEPQVHEYEIKNLEFFMQYYVKMRISNSKGTSGWTRYGPWYTAGGELGSCNDSQFTYGLFHSKVSIKFPTAPTQPLFQEPTKLSFSETELHWQPPVQSYKEDVLYHVRYRPVPKGQPVVDWQRASETKDHDIRVRVNCSLVKDKNGSPFEFEVRAVTKRGESSAVTKHLDMCDNAAVALSVWIPILVVLCGICIIALIICWCKQSEITKPLAGPKFIDAVDAVINDPKFKWDGERNPFKYEKEKFDTARSANSHTKLSAPVIERMSSKDSSSASTDQGIHDMDIDSVDLKNSAPPTNNANVNSRRCNRYSSGMGQSIVSDCGANGGKVSNRSASNPGMEVFSEDFEDSVFEEIPQDIDDGSMPCLSHTYARSAFNPSPPLTPNEEGIGSSSSLLSSGSTGPHSLLPYSQMAYNPHQRLSSSGSDSSGVNYHMMGSQGLAPVNKDSHDAGSLTYSKLSQTPTSPSPPPDTVVDFDHQATASDEDAAPEYHQMGLRDLGQQDKDGSGGDNQIVAPNNNNEKSPSHFNSIPSVDIGSFVQPHNEFIVATAHIMPTRPQPKVEAQKKPEGNVVKPSQSEATNNDDHSYSVVGRNAANRNLPRNSPRNSPPAPRAQAKLTDSGYVPNGCPYGFSIPKGMPISKPQLCSNGYVPHNSPPTQGGFLGSQSQSPNLVHSPPKGTTDGYAPATPVAMSAIMQGKPLTNDDYIPNTTVV